MTENNILEEKSIEGEREDECVVKVNTKHYIKFRKWEWNEMEY